MRARCCAVAVALIAGITACGSQQSGQWACSWESRHSACGGGNYTAWEASCSSFWEDDYSITPQEHCSKMAANDTHCASSCCIHVEGRNMRLTPGSCP